MVNLDCLETSYHDENLLELEWSPTEAELIIPRFIKRDREREIVYWEKEMEKAVEKLEQSELERSKKGPIFTIEEALLLIQRHERARQGRLRAKLMMDICVSVKSQCPWPGACSTRWGMP